MTTQSTHRVDHTQRPSMRSAGTRPSANPRASLEGEEKVAYVRGMFERIAGRYDLMNVLMSFGQDAMWRGYVVRLSGAGPGRRSLDVGTGTGLIAQEAARKGAMAVGVDFCLPMIAQGRSEGVGGAGGVYFAGADALRLPFGDDTFDCITTGFMMRNVVDIEAAFREMRRVLKPGGRLVCLEVGRPRWAAARLFHGIYTRRLVPLLGRIVAGDADAYTYLPSSMGRFPAPPELAQIMRAAGLKKVGFRQLTMGAVAVHRGTK